MPRFYTPLPLRLPARFCLTIEGQLDSINHRAIIVPSALPHLLHRLLSGDSVNPDAFAAFGIRVTVEEDCDQADDNDVPPTGLGEGARHRR